MTVIPTLLPSLSSFYLLSLSDPSTPGHIVHRGCANSYYDTQATANFPQFSCPLCKGRYQSKDEIRTLYPPTTGLNVRNIKTCDEMVAAIMSTQAQEDTINQLLDFQQLIMTWAKAVRDVDLQTVELAGDKVRKLIPRLSGQDHHDWNNRFNVSRENAERRLVWKRKVTCWSRYSQDSKSLQGVICFL